MKTQEGVTLFEEDFREGLDPERWPVFSGDGFATDGAVAQLGESGIVVAPSGRDPARLSGIQRSTSDWARRR